MVEYETPNKGYNELPSLTSAEKKSSFYEDQRDYDKYTDDTRDICLGRRGERPGEAHMNGKVRDKVEDDGRDER
ncbi:MAG: hypothetical protein M1814_002000 [Vezdaea aestivalis]|nr:MAG: hypothetical protein M1814_002000 [Vezdaea aestivalis]